MRWPAIAPKGSKREASATGSAHRNKLQRKLAQTSRRNVSLGDVMTPGQIALSLFDEVVRQLNKQLKAAGEPTVKVYRVNGRGYAEIRKDVDTRWRALLGEHGTVTIGVDK